jgi:hypothetical protein
LAQADGGGERDRGSSRHTGGIDHHQYRYGLCRMMHYLHRGGPFYVYSAGPTWFGSRALPGDLNLAARAPEQSARNRVSRGLFTVHVPQMPRDWLRSAGWHLRLAVPAPTLALTQVQVKKAASIPAPASI